MNVLEKILEEIDRLKDPYYVGYVERDKVKDIIRSHMNNGKDTNVPSNWIPVEKGVPEINKKVLATVKHSSWISDFNSDWVPEDKKIHYPETQNTYIAYVNENNEWIFMDEEGNENICDKEFGIDMERVYDVVTHWQPLPEPYKGEEAAG